MYTYIRSPYGEHWVEQSYTVEYTTPWPRANYPAALNPAQRIHGPPMTGIPGIADILSLHTGQGQYWPAPARNLARRIRGPRITDITDMPDPPGARNPPAPAAAPDNRGPPTNSAPRNRGGSRRNPAARDNRAPPVPDIAVLLDRHGDQGRYLYFAYGSNIQVAQMAERCPGSIFVGSATLQDHRWQINERGVGNVVRSRGHRVEGLAYLVDATDERALDRREGIAKKYYERQFREIDLTPHPTLYGQKSSFVAAELAGNNVPPRVPTPHQGIRPGRVKALIYVSELYKTDGAIRTEYITRMRLAVADGLKLGMSASFVRKCMNPLINRL